MHIAASLEAHKPFKHGHIRMTLYNIQNQESEDFLGLQTKKIKINKDQLLTKHGKRLNQNYSTIF